MPDLGQKCTRANFAGQDLGHRSARLGRCGESVFHMICGERKWKEDSRKHLFQKQSEPMI